MILLNKTYQKGKKKLKTGGNNEKVGRIEKEKRLDDEESF